MSRDIEGMLASGEKLSDEDVAYATDHGINLPEEYGAAVQERKATTEMGLHEGPLVQTGPQYASAPGEPGLFLSEDALSGLTKPVLEAIADAAGIEVNGTKPEMVAALSGSPVSDDESDEDEDEE